MSIDKALPSVPGEMQAGLNPVAVDVPEEPIPVGSVEIVMADDDGTETLLQQAAAPQQMLPEAFNANLAEYMTDSQRGLLASDLLHDVEDDIRSRDEWSKMFTKGLEVLGMKIEERTTPWEGACGVFSPILNEAAIRFQSEMITETFPAQGPVKTKIIGAIDKLKEEAAARVRDDMNHRLTDTMIEYRPEHERLLYALGLVGAAFKKVYYDEALGREVSLFVPAEDMIIPYGASNIYTAERYTYVMRKTQNEVKKLQVAGLYRNVELGEPANVYDDVEKAKAEEEGVRLLQDNRHHLYEIVVDYLVPGFETVDSPDGIARPYVITIDKATREVMGVYRNWAESDPKKLRRQHFVQYTYIPGFGAYGLGLIHLIGGYAKAGTSIIRQLVDAGTLSNLPGGLKTRGLRTKNEDTPIGPGEWRDVDVPAGTLKENLMPLPYKEPSQVLAGLLEKITEDGRRLAATADLKMSDVSAQAPVGTTLAILERQLKTMSAVQQRCHASLAIEFKLLKGIVAEHAPDEYEYVPEKAVQTAKKDDYAITEIIPVSDPNATTMAQRIMLGQAALQMSEKAPQIYNLPELHRQMLETFGFKNADKIVPVDEDQKPRDPVSENMSFLTGKPTKAFIYQDHDAHIATHMSLMQDPAIMGMLGQSPMAQQMMGAIMSHIAEHMAFKYRQQIEQNLGVPMTAPDEEMDEQTEVLLSRAVAMAAQQLLRTNVQNAQQQQAQKIANDPMFQLEQQKVAIKERESQRDYDAALKKIQTEFKADLLKIQSDNKIAMDKMRVELQKAQMQNRARSRDKAVDAATKMTTAAQKGKETGNGKKSDT